MMPFDISLDAQIVLTELAPYPRFENSASALSMIRRRVCWFFSSRFMLTSCKKIDHLVCLRTSKVQIDRIVNIMWMFSIIGFTGSPAASGRRFERRLRP